MSATRPEINLHPTSHHPSSLSTRLYDVVVIGGGPSGEMTASRCTRGGLSALLIESELVGGECPYWACVPSKALLRPAETIDSANAVGGARELIRLAEKYGMKGVDLEGTWKRRDFFTRGWVDDGAIKMMNDSGVDVVRGFGRLSGVKKVSVQTFGSEERVEFEARHAVVIATGSDPVMPNVPGLISAKPWTPREAVSAREVPQHLIVLGSGPVGTELATVYRQLGSEVTLITRNQRILSKFEPEAGKRVLANLEKSGVEVRLGADVERVERVGKDVFLEVSGKGKVSGTEVLVATGRKTRTTDLGLEAFGLPGDGAKLAVDDSLRVKALQGGWLYAIGDTNGIAPLTHIGKYQGKIGGDAIVARAKGSYQQNEPTALFSKVSFNASVNAIPQVTFTDPQVASVGSTLQTARKMGKKVKEASTKMAGPGTFLHAEGYDGWAQWVVEEETGRLLGATFVGRDVADLLHASTVAIVGGMSVEQLWHAIPPFPTMSENYINLLEACGL